MSALASKCSIPPRQTLGVLRNLDRCGHGRIAIVENQTDKLWTLAFASGRGPQGPYLNGCDTGRPVAWVGSTTWLAKNQQHTRHSDLSLLGVT